MGFRFRALSLLLLQVLLLFLLETAKAEDFYNISNVGSMKQERTCNLFEGKWVFDPSLPLYESSSCPFIDPEFNCQKYGRPDRSYLKYTWKPDFCDLPRYYFSFIFLPFFCLHLRFSILDIFLLSFMRHCYANVICQALFSENVGEKPKQPSLSLKICSFLWRFDGLELLRRWRGKKIMFVGDSLSLNMWQSITCMIQASAPKAKISIVRRESLSTVIFQASSFPFSFSSNFLIQSLPLHSILIVCLLYSLFLIHFFKSCFLGYAVLDCLVS